MKGFQWLENFVRRAGDTMTGLLRVPVLMLGDSSVAPDQASGINLPNGIPIRWRNAGNTGYISGFNYDSNSYFTAANSALVVAATTRRAHFGGVSGTAPSAQLQSTSGGATLPALIAEAASAQTANIFEVRQNAVTTPVFAIDDGGQIRTNQRVAAVTLGAVTGKIEVFNGAGVSQGFIPIYNTIT
jgi:hypothetical protein